MKKRNRKWKKITLRENRTEAKESWKRENEENKGKKRKK